MMIRKHIPPKTVTVVIVALVVLGGGISLFHSSSNLIWQENSTHKVYMLPDRASSLGKHTVGAQEELTALRDSSELENQAQMLPLPDSNPTNASEPKITSQATEEMWEELADELER